MQLRPGLDTAHRAVLADWLSERGDPRGELLSLELTLESNPAHREHLAARLATLRAELEPRWVAELAATMSVTLEQLEEFLPGHWYAGLLLEAALCPVGPLANPEVSAVLLEWLLDSDAAIALEALDLGELPAQRSIEELATGPVRPTLERLVIGDFLSPVGPLAELSDALPSLRRLELRGPQIDLAGLVLPELTYLRLCCESDWELALASLPRGHWPKLEILELRLGGHENPDIKTEALIGPLSQLRAPTLSQLALLGFEYTPECLEQLCRLPLLSQLHRLSLSELSLGPAHIEVLRANAAHLASIQRFDLRPLHTDAWQFHHLIDSESVLERLPMLVC